MVTCIVIIVNQAKHMLLAWGAMIVSQVFTMMTNLTKVVARDVL